MANDALATLLNLQSPTNRTPGAPGSSVSAYTPRIQRNSAKVAMLRRMLGMGEDDGGISQADLESTAGYVGEQQAAAAEQETYPERVRGEYGLATERLKGQSAVEAARLAREAAAQERMTQREFQAGQGQLNREAIAGRQAGVQAATTGRAQAREQNIGQRQRLSRAEGRIKAMEAGKAEPKYPPTSGIEDTLKYYLGLGPYDRETAMRAQSEKMRQEAMQVPGEDTGGIETIAGQYLQQYGNLSEDALVDAVIANEPDASPEELDALFTAISGLRGR